MFLKLTSYSIKRKQPGGIVYVNLAKAATIRRSKPSPEGTGEWTNIEFPAISDEADCSEAVIETPEEIFSMLIKKGASFV